MTGPRRMCRAYGVLARVRTRFVEDSVWPVRLAHDRTRKGHGLLSLARPRKSRGGKRMPARPRSCGRPCQSRADQSRPDVDRSERPMRKRSCEEMAYVPGGCQAGSPRAQKGSRGPPMSRLSPGLISPYVHVQYLTLPRLTCLWYGDPQVLCIKHRVRYLS